MSATDAELARGPDARWSVAPGSTVAVERIGDGLAFYCRTSGETHVLDAFPAEIYDYLSYEGPGAKAGQVAVAIAAQFDEGAIEWQERVEAALGHMAALSIVTKHPP